MAFFDEKNYFTLSNIEVTISNRIFKMFTDINCMPIHLQYLLIGILKREWLIKTFIKN